MAMLTSAFILEAIEKIWIFDEIEGLHEAFDLDSTFTSEHATFLATAKTDLSDCFTAQRHSNF